jgi:DNA polymerase III subunit delta'
MMQPRSCASVYPWQVPQWQFIYQCQQQNRLSHALLLTGMRGVGKQHFAKALCLALLCTHCNQNGYACDHCHDCHLINSQTHPNFLLIAADDKASVIKIDQIRQINEFCQQTSLQGVRKVVLINDACAMNHFAANALLKTLEEPPLGTIIILVCEQKSRLPATIISRCQTIIFNRPEALAALNWLEPQVSESQIATHLLLDLSYGAPLLALEYAHQEILALRKSILQALLACSVADGQQNITAYAHAWQDHDILLVLNFIVGCLLDMLRLKLKTGANILNQDYSSEIMQIARKIAQKNLLNYLDFIQNLRRETMVGVNLNKQLLLESLLIRWQNLERAL